MQPRAAARHPLVVGPLRALLAGARPGLLLDFDGTLSDLVDRAEDARLRPDCATALERLLRLGVPLAVVSGRALPDLAARCRLPGAGHGLDGAWLAGLHGADLAAPGAAPRAAPPDAAVRSAVEAFIEAARRLAPLGVRVEDKGAAAAAHVRPIADPDRRREAVAALRRVAEGLALLGAVACIEGHAVVEVRPRGATKAGAVEALRGRWPAGTVLVAVGDDTTDEDLFAAALRAGGTAVKVGPGPSAAPHRLADPADVAAFLSDLGDALADAGCVSPG